MPEPAPDPRYDELPVSIQARVSRREYAWMSDERKANLVEEFTQPPADAEDQAE